MAQVVKPHALQASGPACSGPWLLEVRPRRAVLRPGNQMRVSFDPRKVRQHLLGGGGEVERLLACLAVGEENQSALDVDLLPFGVKNFAKTSASENQETKGSRRISVELDAPMIGFRSMLGCRLGFVNGIGKAHRLAFPQRVAEPRQFLACQKALSPLLAVFLDALRRVRPLGNQARAGRPCKSL